MKEQEDLSFTKTIVKLVQTCVALIADVFDLAATELRLAQKNLIRIIWLFILICLFLISVWFFSLATLAAWLVSLHLSWPLALLAVTGLNALLLVIALIVILRAGYSLTFPATRRQLRFSGVKHGKSFRRKTKKKNS